MQKGGGGWSLKGTDPCTEGAWEADPEAGSEAGVTGDDEQGRRRGFPGASMASAGPGEKEDREVRP